MSSISLWADGKGNSVPIVNMKMETIEIESSKRFMQPMKGMTINAWDHQGRRLEVATNFHSHDELIKFLGSRCTVTEEQIIEIVLGDSHSTLLGLTDEQRKYLFVNVLTMNNSTFSNSEMCVVTHLLKDRWRGIKFSLRRVHPVPKNTVIIRFDPNDMSVLRSEVAVIGLKSKYDDVFDMVNSREEFNPGETTYFIGKSRVSEVVKRLGEKYPQLKIDVENGILTDSSDDESSDDESISEQFGVLVEVEEVDGKIATIHFINEGVIKVDMSQLSKNDRDKLLDEVRKRGMYHKLDHTDLSFPLRPKIETIWRLIESTLLHVEIKFVDAKKSYRELQTSTEPKVKVEISTPDSVTIFYRGCHYVKVNMTCLSPQNKLKIQNEIEKTKATRVDDIRQIFQNLLPGVNIEYVERV
jgi:hypothetical protein